MFGPEYNLKIISESLKILNNNLEAQNNILMFIAEYLVKEEK